MSSSSCVVCGGKLLPLDVSFSLKLIGRHLTEFTCRECLKKKFSFTDEDLDAMQKRFHDEGCALFQFGDETK